MPLSTVKNFLMSFGSYPAGFLATVIALILIILNFIYASWKSIVASKTKEGRKNERKMDFFEILLDELHSLGGANMCCGIKLKSKSSLPYDHVYNALQSVASKYSQLRTVIVQKSDDVKCFRVVDGQNMVDLKKLDVEDWVPVWENAAQTKFDTERGPLWHAILLKETYDSQTQQYQNTIMFAFYHGTMDGMAVLTFMREFLKCLENVSKGRSTIIDNICTGIPLGMMTALASKLPLHFKILLFFTPAPVLLLFMKLGMRIYFSLDAENPFTSAEYGNSTVGEERIKIIPRQLNKDITRKLMACSRKNGCTVYGMIAACCHLAVAKLSQREKGTKLSWNCPVNVRAQCEPRITEDDLGSYTTALIENIRVPQINAGDSIKFWDFARQCTRLVHSGIRNGRHLGPIYLYPVAHLLKPKEFISEFLFHSQIKNPKSKSPAHSLSNLGKIDWKTTEDDTYEIESVFGGSGAYRNGATFANHMATFNDVFTWSTSYVTTNISDKTAEKYVDLVFDTLLDVLSCSKEQ